MSTNKNHHHQHRDKRDGPPHKSHADFVAAHIREFKLPDGRRIAVDRRSVAFAVQCKEHPTERTVLAFRAGKAGPCPVMAPIDAVLPWWTGEDDKPRPADRKREQDKPKPAAPAKNGNGAWKAPTRPGSPPAKSSKPADDGKKLSEAEAERRAKALAVAKTNA